MLTIVLLPGMDGTGALFSPFIAALDNAFNVVTVRYPTTEGLGYAELEVIARRSLPLQGNFIILGESFSGPIAVSLASSSPTGLVGLVLCSTFIRNSRPQLKRFSTAVHFLPIKAAPVLVRDFFLMGGAATAELSFMLKAAIGQVSGVALRARLRAVLDVDVSSKLESVRVPVLVLRARHDRLVPSKACEAMAGLHSDLQIISIDAPHCLLQATPQEAAVIVKNFVGALSSRETVR